MEDGIHSCGEAVLPLLTLCDYDGANQLLDMEILQRNFGNTFAPSHHSTSRSRMVGSFLDESLCTCGIDHARRGYVSDIAARPRWQSAPTLTNDNLKLSQHF
eukprot:1596012-Pleurochrysis_carterae.AAC.1